MEEKADKRYHFDAGLIQATLAGDERSKRLFCEKLIQAAYAFTYGACNGFYRNLDIDRENIVSGVIFKAWKNLRHFDGRSKYSTYLSSIVRNEIKNELRRRNCRPEGYISRPLPEKHDSEDDSAASIFDMIAGEDGNETVRYSDAAKVIRQKVGNIANQAHRKCVELWIDGYSYDEISEQLDLTSGGVGSIIHRFKKDMRNVLKDFMEN